MPPAAPTRPLHLAFLGCGLATRLHSRTLARFPATEVRRFYASREAAKAEAWNRRYRGSGAFAGYDAALADARIDAVLVATPPASHLALTLRALEAGKDVIVEKPAFLRAADFDTVRGAQLASGRRVFVAENYFYKPLAERLRALLAAGAVGEVRLLLVNALKHQRTGDWRDDAAQAGGGALFEGGVHWVNFMANLGLDVAAAHGFRAGSGSGPERSMLAVFEYESGAVGTLFHSWETRSPLRGLRLSRVYGSEGAIAFESNGLFLLVHGRRPRLAVPRPTDLLGYRAMFADFLDALRRGTEPRMTLEKAQRDHELLEQIYRSAAPALPLHGDRP
jgi:UDP-N-acetylglucosamine 3-dehydrogenase